MLGFGSQHLSGGIHPTSTRHMHGSMQCSITARQIILHMSPLQASADSSPEVAACCHQRPRFHFVRARAIGHNLPCTIDVHCSSSSTSLTWTKKCGRTSLLVMVCIAHRHFSTCVEEHWKFNIESSSRRRGFGDFLDPRRAVSSSVLCPPCMTRLVFSTMSQVVARRRYEYDGPIDQSQFARARVEAALACTSACAPERALTSFVKIKFG